MLFTDKNRITERGHGSSDLSLRERLDKLVFGNAAIPPAMKNDEGNGLNTGWFDAAEAILRGWLSYSATTQNPGSVSDYAKEYQRQHLNTISTRTRVACFVDAKIEGGSVQFEERDVIKSLLTTIAVIARDYTLERQLRGTPVTQQNEKVFGRVATTDKFVAELAYAQLPEKLMDCQKRNAPDGWLTAANSIFSDWMRIQSKRLPSREDALIFATTHHPEELARINSRVNALQKLDDMGRKETVQNIFEAMASAARDAKTIDLPGPMNGGRAAR